MLFGDRQLKTLRLCRSMYVLVDGLRRAGLADTSLANATCGTIRLKLLKIGARVRVSVRRIRIAMASGCPNQREFAAAHELIGKAANWCGHQNHRTKIIPKTLGNPDFGYNFSLLLLTLIRKPATTFRV